MLNIVAMAKKKATSSAADAPNPQTTHCCTWEGCNKAATMPQRNHDGSIWANLCGAHDKELQQAFAISAHLHLGMRAWSKATGGDAAVVKRIFSATKSIDRE